VYNARRGRSSRVYKWKRRPPKWEDKHLKDLKKRISLTPHWLEVETLTLEVIADMPEGKP
jgi:hypothetical protein